MGPNLAAVVEEGGATSAAQTARRPLPLFIGSGEEEGEEDDMGGATRALSKMPTIERKQSLPAAVRSSGAEEESGAAKSAKWVRAHFVWCSVFASRMCWRCLRRFAVCCAESAAERDVIHLGAITSLSPPTQGARQGTRQGCSWGGWQCGRGGQAAAGEHH